MADVAEMIRLIATNLVDQAAEVKVREEREGEETVYHLEVARPDVSRVIGRQGRTAQAIRTLITTAVNAEGGGRRVAFNIVD